MLIIPVIDLLGGVVVRARGGRRDVYRPIVTPLAASSEPCEVLAGMSRLHAFTTVYIADLDAILGRGNNVDAVRRLQNSFPHVAFWLDAGARDAAPGSSLEWVVGSESLSDDPPPDLSAAPNAILSLDFRGELFLGPPALASTPRLWPARVIVMTLGRVGMAEGPDFARLAAVKAVAGPREIFAAGGVRGGEDLAALARMGVTGALVASALHDGALGARDLALFGAPSSVPGA